MTYFIWTFRLIFTCLTIGFLHYTLPQHDILRITGTDIIRRDFGGFSQIFYAQNRAADAALQNYDLRLISAVRLDGAISVYRNEDTGWGWPPYFKFGTSNIQAQATDLISNKNDESITWVLLRHYGWRSELLSIYPNVVRMQVIDDPDMRLIPWQNIVTLAALFAVFWGLRVRWRRFWAARVEPALDEVTAGLDEVGTHVAGRAGRFFDWLRQFFKVG